MNAYFCDAGDLRVTVDRVPYGEWTVDVPGIERVCTVVLAKTRGQARKLFIEHFRHGLEHSGIEVHLEFTDKISIRKLDDGYLGEPGIVPHDHPLWQKVMIIAEPSA